MPLQRTLTRLNVMMLVRTNGPLYVQCRSEDIVLEFPYLIIESMLWVEKRAGIGNHLNFKCSHCLVKLYDYCTTFIITLISKVPWYNWGIWSGERCMGNCGRDAFIQVMAFVCSSCGKYKRNKYSYYVHAMFYNQVIDTSMCKLFLLLYFQIKDREKSITEEKSWRHGDNYSGNSFNTNIIQAVRTNRYSGRRNRSDIGIDL